jgi:hypothetical protein
VEAKMRFLGKLKQRNEGVGSIIGAVFIMLILLSGLTFYATYLNITDHYSETTQSMGDLSWSQNQERIVIKQVSLTTNNNLNLTVENQGSVHSHLIWLGMFNKSAVPENQSYYTLDESLNPSETRNIVSSFTVAHNLKYVVQLVTELGNTVQNVFYPASAAQCALSLTVAPPTTYAGNNVTVMLTVTLNDTEVDIVQNITASISAAPTNWVELVGNSPLTVTGLARGENAFFWWVYNIINTGTVTFNATYSSAPVGSYALTNVNVLATPGQGGGSGGGSSVAVSGVNGTAEYNPSQFNPLGGTQNVSGSVAALSANDGSYAIFGSYYSGTATDSNHFVDNNASNVDGSPNRGTQSNFTAMQYGPDSNYDTLTETSGSTTPTPYYPSSYNSLGSTVLVSGTPTALQADDGTYMTFRSYQTASSGQSLYAHSETTTISGTPFYLNKLASAEQTGTSLSASMGTTGRKLFGKFVYPLTAVSSIPASTWTMNYRTWADAGQVVTFDSSNSGNNKASATVSWSHTTGSKSNRIMIVGVSIMTTTVSVSGITYGRQSLTFIRADTDKTTVKSELWYLVAPASGTAAVTVTLSGSSEAVGGSSTFFGVSQASPLDADTGLTGSSITPSQSIKVNTPNSMLVGHLAISGSTATVSSEGEKQTRLWDDFSQTEKPPTGCRGHGSQEGPVSADSQSMSWKLSESADWAVSILALTPANSIGHVDIDILIRKSDGTVRATIANGVASSTDLGASAATLSATYSWAGYTVVDQTDYLEIDYYVHVTNAGAALNAYLRIDDNTLATASQTRADNVMLPSQYTVATEFLGSSNTQSWSQLAWTIDSSFTTSGVTATFQLYNYTAGAYSTVGDGYKTDTIGTANVTETQIITINPTQFRDANGNWKLKIQGVKTTNTQFDWQGDFVKYEEVPSATYGVDLEVQWTNAEYAQANKWLCIYGGTMAAENLRVDWWDGSTWNNLFTALSSGWNNVSVSPYLTSSTFTIRFTDASNDTSQDSWNMDVALLHLWTITDQYTAEVEFTGSSNLQNWTSLLWQIQSCWDTNQVAVNIQLYNFTLGAYASSGNGYLSYVSSATPNTNELQSKTENSSPSDFKDSTGHWRVKITGVKSTSTEFLMKIDWINLYTAYSTTGETIPYDAWQLYSIKATTASGGPIPYAYVSIYANGTSIAFRNATDKTDVWYNPTSSGLRLDSSGTIQLEIKSASGSAETFILYAVVGSEVGQKTVIQENPP